MSGLFVVGRSLQRTRNAWSESLIGSKKEPQLMKVEQNKAT
jgi:hypothetical protein